ncbi:Protein TsgA [Buchnera aphidicola (Anoecia corni)]|uniref:Protein TsgA n=1 Tax=Buchnera aphidicola (Anoecia corni) TaxID=2994477 RepID=A0AAT9IHI8_9GAMM
MMNYNRVGLTWISFLSYAFTGALVTVTGIVMGNIAKDFKLSLVDMSNSFTYLNSGILTAMFINNWCVKIISLKKQIFFSFALAVLSIFGLSFFHSITIFSCSMFILGSVSGLTMSIGTFIIANLYHGTKRATFLLLTDSFFSMAGIFFPFITGFLLAKNVPWNWIYILIGIIDLFIFFIAISVQFPLIKEEKTEIHSKLSKNGTISVILLAISAFFYILGQLGFISWVPQFVMQNMHANINYSSQLVSNFWMAYMVGMWFFTVVLTLFDLQKIVIFLTSTSTVLMYIFIHSNNIHYLPWIISMLGFFSSAIYTIIITLASLQKKIASPKIVNFILTSGTIGTLLTFVFTGPIVAAGGVNSALNTANFLYLIVCFLHIIIIYFSQHKKYLLRKI